ncbi:MAG: hypothetical protein ACR2GY_00555 [Phycisphaerales bacterium]
MHVSAFLEHHGMSSNPFRDEEARHDDVLTSLASKQFEHAEAGKIVGDFNRPTSAVVFGEKGSGKTAIRLQIARAINTHNQQHPDNRVLPVAYDDLNTVLDRFSRRVNLKHPEKALEKLTLNDHMDGILQQAVPQLVDAALGERSASANGHDDEGSIAIDPAALKRMPRARKLDWLLLQALYDRPQQAVERGPRLARALRVFSPARLPWLKRFTLMLWLLSAAGYLWYMFFERIEPEWMMLSGLVLLIGITVGVTGMLVYEWFRMGALARKVAGQLRVLDRMASSIQTSLSRLPKAALNRSLVPVDDLEETRYGLLATLRQMIEPLGYRNIAVLIDRVDEPSLVRGDAAHMRSVIWPMFDNKFLQLPGYAIKMMLPLELRYALYGQSKDFFQHARLDKQNLIDRLEWSGVTLFDLCNQRMAACTPEGTHAATLPALFDTSITREDIIAALDQMRQPRDAFKLLYAAIQQHCHQTSDDDPDWTIARASLLSALDRQKERLDALRSGLGPA